MINVYQIYRQKLVKVAQCGHILLDNKLASYHQAYCLSQKLKDYNIQRRRFNRASERGTPYMDNSLD